MSETMERTKGTNTPEAGGDKHDVWPLEEAGNTEELWRGLAATDVDETFDEAFDENGSEADAINSEEDRTPENDEPKGDEDAVASSRAFLRIDSIMQEEVVAPAEMNEECFFGREFVEAKGMCVPTKENMTRGELATLHNELKKQLYTAGEELDPSQIDEAEMYEAISAKLTEYYRANPEAAEKRYTMLAEVIQKAWPIDGDGKMLLRALINSSPDMADRVERLMRSGLGRKPISEIMIETFSQNEEKIAKRESMAEDKYIKYLVGEGKLSEKELRYFRRCILGGEEYPMPDWLNDVISEYPNCYAEFLCDQHKEEIFHPDQQKVKEDLVPLEEALRQHSEELIGLFWELMDGDDWYDFKVIKKATKLFAEMLGLPYVPSIITRLQGGEGTGMFLGRMFGHDLSYDGSTFAKVGEISVSFGPFTREDAREEAAIYILGTVAHELLHVFQDCALSVNGDEYSKLCSLNRFFYVNCAHDYGTYVEQIREAHPHVFGNMVMDFLRAELEKSGRTRAASEHEPKQADGNAAGNEDSNLVGAEEEKKEVGGVSEEEFLENWIGDSLSEEDNEKFRDVFMRRVNASNYFRDWSEAKQEETGQGRVSYAHRAVDTESLAVKLAKMVHDRRESAGIAQDRASIEHGNSWLGIVPYEQIQLGMPAPVGEPEVAKNRYAKWEERTLRGDLSNQRECFAVLTTIRSGNRELQREYKKMRDKYGRALAELEASPELTERMLDKYAEYTAGTYTPSDKEMQYFVAGALENFEWNDPFRADNDSQRHCWRPWENAKYLAAIREQKLKQYGEAVFNNPNMQEIQDTILPFLERIDKEQMGKACEWLREDLEGKTDAFVYMVGSAVNYFADLFEIPYAPETWVDFDSEQGNDAVEWAKELVVGYNMVVSKRQAREMWTKVASFVSEIKLNYWQTIKRGANVKEAAKEVVGLVAGEMWRLRQQYMADGVMPDVGGRAKLYKAGLAGYIPAQPEHLTERERQFVEDYVKNVIIAGQSN